MNIHEHDSLIQNLIALKRLVEDIDPNTNNWSEFNEIETAIKCCEKYLDLNVEFQNSTTIKDDYRLASLLEESDWAENISKYVKENNHGLFDESFNKIDLRNRLVKEIDRKLSVLRQISPLDPYLPKYMLEQNICKAHIPAISYKNSLDLNLPSTHIMILIIREFPRKNLTLQEIWEYLLVQSHKYKFSGNFSKSSKDEIRKSLDRYFDILNNDIKKNSDYKGNFLEKITNKSVTIRL